MAGENFRDKYTRPGMIGGLLVDRFFRCVGGLICVPAGARVLEVGVGEGFSTRRIRQMLPASASLEASELRPDLAQVASARNPGITIRQESIYELRHAADAFDLVVCLEVLEHLEYPERALRELARVARGAVIVSVPREPVWRILNMLRGKYLDRFGNTPGHIRHWSKSGIKNFVSPWFAVVGVHAPLPWTVLLLRPKK